MTGYKLDYPICQKECHICKETSYLPSCCACQQGTCIKCMVPCMTNRIYYNTFSVNNFNVIVEKANCVVNFNICKKCLKLK